MKTIRILTDEGVEFFPGTITDAIGHDQMESSLTKLINRYNISKCFSTSGIGDSDKYDLSSAITLLGEKLNPNQKFPGVHVEFLNESGANEDWEYFGQGYEFTNELGWRRVDSSIILELQETLFPVSVNFNVSPTVIKTKTPTNVNFTFSVIRKNKNVTSDAVKYFNGEVITGTSKTISVNESSHKTISYTFSGAYQGLTASSTKTITIVDDCYYGIVSASWTPNSSTVSALLKTSIKSNKSFTWSGINLTNQRVCYAFPKYYNALSSIKDGNNFEYITDSYTRTDIVIDGVDYYAYTLTRPVTISGFKQIYS